MWVVLAGEIGGPFSEETLRLLARAKTRSIPEPLRTRARQSWVLRWGFILVCAAARALLGRGPPGSRRHHPSGAEVLADFSKAPRVEE